jgi:hypothetical protein
MSSAGSVTSSKNAARKDRLETDGAIREVIELTRSEAMKNGVSVRTELADALSPIEGERVELQQVILNLVINAIEAMCGVSGGAGELLIRIGKAESEGLFVAGSRFGYRAGVSESRAPLRGFLHDQAGRWGWGCRSAVRSSKPTVDDCGRARMCPAEPFSIHGARGRPKRTLKRPTVAPAEGLLTEAVLKHACVVANPAH